MSTPKGPPYKSSNHQWYTKSLFWEPSRTMQYESELPEPVFTLGEDRPGFISGRKTFVEIGDPTGYQWAIKYLGDYNHWKQLMKTKWFPEAVAEWVHELNLRLKSEAIVRIIAIAASDTPQAGPANKYLASLQWEQKTRGRPSKEEMDRELKRATEVVELEDQDLERIGLKLIKGGKT